MQLLNNSDSIRNRKLESFHIHPSPRKYVLYAPDMYIFPYKALLNSFIHTLTNGYPVFNILYRHARGLASSPPSHCPICPESVTRCRYAHFQRGPDKRQLLRVSQIIAQMVQVVARMGYPVASLIIQKVNLVSVDDGEVPDGIICLPRWVIGLFDLVFFDCVSQQNAVEHMRLSAQFFQRTPLLTKTVCGDQAVLQAEAAASFHNGIVSGPIPKRQDRVPFEKSLKFLQCHFLQTP